MRGLRISISTKRLKQQAHYIIILIAGLSTVLRPAIESKLTLFRLLLPFIFVWFLWVNPKKAGKFFLITIFFLIYSLLVSYFGRFHSFSIVFNLYYITTIFFYFYYREVAKACGAQAIYIFLVRLFKVLIILGYLQMMFGGVYFNTQDRYPMVNIFFWNENEYSAVLAIFTPLYFLAAKSRLKFLWISAAIGLIAFNDAKLAVLALIIFFTGYAVMKLRWFKLKYLGFALLGLIGSLFLFMVRDYTIEGDYTVNFLVEDLFEHILAQEPFVHIGTFNARANAIILGIKELVNSWFLGIGPGNSILMMKEIVVPGTERWTALSMHNFILQIITEIGVLGIFLLYCFYYKIQKVALISTKYSRNLIWIFYISCAISISLLSGAWSNYFYLFILLYSLDFFRVNV